VTPDVRGPAPVATLGETSGVEREEHGAGALRGDARDLSEFAGGLPFVGEGEEHAALVLAGQLHGAKVWTVLPADAALTSCRRKN
jgi:hypothetical protein